jgi:hypothetical protein
MKNAGPSRLRVNWKPFLPQGKALRASGASRRYNTEKEHRLKSVLIKQNAPTEVGAHFSMANSLAHFPFFVKQLNYLNYN